MTNTKFRKRALLSSVAMLLVALVALGSATFAWYQAQMTVSAAGMTFSTNSAAGLEIISSSEAHGSYSADATQADLEGIDYKTSTTLSGANTNLQPASANASGAFFQTTGTGKADGTIATNAVVETSTNYIEERVYFKTTSGATSATGTVTLTGITFGSASASLSPYRRVVVYNSSGTRMAEYAPSANESAPCLVATGTNGTDTVTGTKAVLAASSSVTAVTVSNVSADKSVSNFCMVRVYLDGMASAVNSDAAAAIHSATEILGGINMTFTFVPSA